MRLRSKILGYTLPLILLPFLLTAAAVYYFIIRVDRVRSQEETARNIAVVVAGVRKELDSARRDVALISRVPAVIDYLQDPTSPSREEAASTVLKLFFTQNPYYLKLMIVGADGREKVKFSRMVDDEPRSLTAEDYFRRTLITGTVQTPVREIRPSLNVTALTHRIVGPVFLGMVVLLLNTESFERPMRPLLANRGFTTFLVDDRGLIFARSLAAPLDKEDLASLALADRAAELLSNPSVSLAESEIELDGNQFRFTLAPAEAFERTIYEPQAGENWFLGVIERQERSGGSSRSFQLIFLLLILFAVGAVLVTASKFAQRITVPLEDVIRATGEIARGNLQIDLDVQEGDEVGDLANAVRRMTEELNRYQNRLVETAKLAVMGEMTSEISHEIQNRISGISLWLQYLDAEIEADDPKRVYLDEMKQGLQRFLEMLSGLKQYYRTPVLEKTHCNLNALVSEVLADLGEKITERGLAVENELDPSLPEIEADPEKIRGVILNLVLNAVEAVEKGGRVGVRTRSGRDSVFLVVNDDGCGIPEGDIPKIFYPFFSTKGSGGGLGLSIASNIVAAHGGRIEVESRKGDGSEFVVILPR